MDFELNNETYFLDLSDEERGQWIVMAQTPTGMRHIPVYVDDVMTADDLPLLVEDKKRRKIVN
ncbi:MAG: hypothetical protein WAN03_15290 [Candidatus Sulfotelmatobacter sp.]